MLNLKRAAFNISSRFGVLQTHQSLILTISEEQQVYETLLKLVLTRVNASTSLLKWARKENNAALTESIGQLHDINLMCSTIQKEFAEQTNELTVSLKEILQVEIGIDAIKKELKTISAQREKLQKQHTDGIKRRVDQTESNEKDLTKMIEEESALQSELDVKTIKAEIFKSRAIKSSLSKVMKSQVQLSEKMTQLYTTAQLIVDDIPEIPPHLKENSSGNNIDKPDYVSEIAKRLNIKRPSTTTIFHVDLPSSPSKSPPTNATNKALKFPLFKKNKETKDRPIESQLVKQSKSLWEFSDFVFLSNQSAPKEMPPPVPGYRQRSCTTSQTLQHQYIRPFSVDGIHGKKMKQNTYMEYNKQCDGDYIEPNYHGGLTHRSSSDSELSKSDYGYSKPWDIYVDSWGSINNFIEESHNNKKNSHFYEKPFLERDSLEVNSDSDAYDYEDITDKINVYKSLHDDQTSGAELEKQCETSAKKKHEKEVIACRNLPTNAPGIIKSKQDSTDHQIKKTPKPVPRKKISATTSPIVSGSPIRKISTPLMPPVKDAKKKPLMPKPRPKSTNISSEISPLMGKSVFYVDEKNNENITDPPVTSNTNVKDLALQLNGKVYPLATVIPSLTQDRLFKAEANPYQNAI